MNDHWMVPYKVYTFFFTKIQDGHHPRQNLIQYPMKNILNIGTYFSERIEKFKRKFGWNPNVLSHKNMFCADYNSKDGHHLGT